MRIPESLSEESLTQTLVTLGLYTPKVKLAIQQAILSHQNQYREDGQPYLTEHIYPVTAMVVTLFKDKLSEDVIIATLLHDSLEDDPSFTNEELEKKFGNKVSLLVESLSKPRIEESLSETEKRQMVNQKYFKDLSKAPYEARVIKLLDRIDNLYWAITFGKELVIIYLDETKNFYLHFAKEVDDELYEVILSLLTRLEKQAKLANFI